MAKNHFDQASRFAVRLDPLGFLVWAFRVPDDAIAFRGWLDTRGIAFPGATDRTGDSVARVEHPEGIEPPWAIAVEFQREPDATMFGRLMIYLGHLWLDVKSDEERNSRFNVGAVVVNLTGTGRATRRMEWLATGLTTHLEVVERNMGGESADEFLTEIEGARRSRGLLPWIPLMTGADEPGIIERWKLAANADPSYRRRAEYGGLAKTFAGAMDWKDRWLTALKEWNVNESQAVLEWIAEGEAKGEAKACANLVLKELDTKGEPVPEELVAAILAQSSVDVLMEWVATAFRCPDIANFRQRTGL